MQAPLLLVVAGPPGSGKTTLSRLLGDALALPVLCRDAVKEGVVFTTGELVHHGSARAQSLFDAFNSLVDEFLRRGVSVIAEAAFRADIAPAEILQRQSTAHVVLVRCFVPSSVWFDRFRSRGPRPGHVDDEFVARTVAAGGPDSVLYHLDIPGVPTLDVDTTSGYSPDLSAIVDFVRSATRDISR